MRGLTASDLMEIADGAGGLDWAGRGIVLSAYAWSGSSHEERVSLPIGVRDRLLLALRVATFGRTIPVRTRCAACGAELEATVDAGALLESSPAEPPASVTVEADGVRRVLRLPSSGDLIATSSLEPGEAEWALLERCAGDPPPARSGNFRRAAAEGLATADPLANIELELRCGQCGAASPAVLDIVSFLWSEIASGADRAAREVHTLASAYGWTEREILSMAAPRRRRYLAMVNE